MLLIAIINNGFRVFQLNNYFLILIENHKKKSILVDKIIVILNVQIISFYMLMLSPFHDVHVDLFMDELYAHCC